MFGILRCEVEPLTLHLLCLQIQLPKNAMLHLFAKLSPDFDFRYFTCHNISLQIKIKCKCQHLSKISCYLFSVFIFNLMNAQSKYLLFVFGCRIAVDFDFDLDAANCLPECLLLMWRLSLLLLILAVIDLSVLFTFHFRFRFHFIYTAIKLDFY